MRSGVQTFRPTPPPNRAHFPPTSYDTALPPPNPLVQYSMMG